MFLIQLQFLTSMYISNVWYCILRDLWPGSGVTRSRGVLERWLLKLFGSPMTSAEVQERIRFKVPSLLFR